MKGSKRCPTMKCRYIITMMHQPLFDTVSIFSISVDEVWRVAAAIWLLPILSADVSFLVRAFRRYVDGEGPRLVIF